MTLDATWDSHGNYVAGGAGLEVPIDIKPGSDPNSINLGASGVIPAAVLSTPTFDATQVAAESLSLNGSGVRVVGRADRYLCHEDDVNADGLMDLVCQFENELDAEVGDTVAVLEGETLDGTLVRGEDAIRIVPEQ